jgi:hypothetical protein
VKSYRATVSRESGWWVAEVDGVLGGATEATRLVDLETEVRDLLAGLLDQEEDAFELRWDAAVARGGEE